jgi:hypothetical protein
MTDICKIGLLHLTGARTNFLRTLSKINHLAFIAEAGPQGVSPKGAAYYTAPPKKVNTLISREMDEPVKL